MIFSMLTPPYPVRDTHTDEFNELRNKVFYALRDVKSGEPVSDRDELPEEKGSSLQLRNLIRRRHAEWSDKTFGNVGPIGPLKHLSKEALEAAAEPDDLSEWADMQFLLWDAQRRADISDGEITAAMEEKLKVNMARQWPEPKDGEPRLHIKEAGNSPVIPDRWIPVSERVPEKADEVLCAKEFDGPGDWRQKVGYFLSGKWTVYAASWMPTHWMPLPAAPQQEARKSNVIGSYQGADGQEHPIVSLSAPQQE